ncbi:hypothetical protein LEP48_02730 [Isoptericola sp. NEAU-Y5]|uniref:Uncharacterized protein n=1 Tax=Isoptericola luteus TaxID=2879484 RepID=A0ABS7ZET4_9MICO|nr:hypothetical protein [Isoptericola sp. NEAU-Y5]MCA5892265.1 hypothetical protein [Isoptericola sp. NEAU-Y5]
MTSAPRTARLPAAWRPAPGRPTWGIVLGDAVRLGALVSVLLAVAAADWVAVPLFLLVLGGSMVPRATGASAVLDVACGVAMLAAAWCARLGWYERFEGLDLAVHAVATGLLAALAYRVLTRGPLSPVRPPASVATTVVALGATLAVVWEVLEVLGHALVDDSIYVTVPDTVGDLAAGFVGSVVAAALVARSSSRATLGSAAGGTGGTTAGTTARERA